LGTFLVSSDELDGGCHVANDGDGTPDVGNAPLLIPMAAVCGGEKKKVKVSADLSIIPNSRFRSWYTPKCQ
jgi:hypothetical protein